MGAKVLVRKAVETETNVPGVSLPASASVIAESMVATEAELRALWAQVESDGFGVPKSPKRLPHA